LVKYGYQESEIIRELENAKSMMQPKDVMDFDAEDTAVDDTELIFDEENDDLEGFKDYLITSDDVEPYLQVDGSRFHKSNLVNSVLNNMSKLTGCRLLRVCEVKSSAKLEEVIESSGEQSENPIV
jgi:hypothetical protein